MTDATSLPPAPRWWQFWLLSTENARLRSELVEARLHVAMLRQEIADRAELRSEDGGMTARAWRLSAKKAEAIASILGPPDVSTILTAEGIEGMRDVMATVTGIVRTETS